AVLLAGFIILLMSAVYFLSTMMEPWLAALIVGVVVVVIGMVMVSAGKKKFEASSLKPDRTIHSLQKDKEAVRGHA
ncbi:phage holin family protein, partial [Leclercia adecarboxylata]